MNERRDPDRLITAFLMEGQTVLTDQVYDAVRATIEDQRQRVVIGPWRLPAMNKLMPIGLGAAAVVVALVVGAQLLGPPAPSGVGGAPSATPSSTPLPTPAPSVAAPSSQAGGGLPEGPFRIDDPTMEVPITVTIPGPGWTFDRDFTALGKGNEVANLPEATVLFWSFPAGTGFFVFGNPCQATTTRPDTPVTTVDDLAAALSAQVSRDASAPTDVMVGGYTGKSIILHVPDDVVPEECEEGEFASYGTEAEALTRYHQGAGQIDELWILDVDGSILVIDAMYRPDTPADLVEEMRGIVESGTFE